ncbi:MAG: LacI family DNA-binding transcriptional regulator [Verrucomicrobiota bacterium]
MINPRSVPALDRNSSGRRPPLREVADLLGVSKMTVSRALREGTSVESGLRQRIREAARQIGYQPDSRISQVMSAIRKSRSPLYRETLALVWTHRRGDGAAANSFYEEILSGATLQAEQLGYKLDEFHLTDQAMSGRALSRILHSRGIRGVLISPPGSERAFPHVWLDWKKFCCVLIGRSFVNTGLARVQPDHYSDCVLALRRLKRLRHRRIALVVSHSFDGRTGRQVRAAFEGFHPLGPREAAKLVFLDDRPDSAAVAEWLDTARPDVVLANFDSAFSGGERLVSRRGVAVNVAALNWSRHRPGIPGINQQGPLIGETAVDLLLLRMQRHLLGLEDCAPTIQVPGSWMDGASIRRGAAAATANGAATPARRAVPALI